MTLQREYREVGRFVWRDVVKDEQVVLSPIESAPVSSHSIGST